MSTAIIAELGALVGDPARANMLTSLLDGRALTARELAERAGVAPQTASGHLAKLLAGGLIIVERQGRHRYHRLASAEAARMLEVMHVTGAQMPPHGRSSRHGLADPAMRLARSCYDHLAGRLAVALADVMVEGREAFLLSARGERMLRDWGVDLAEVRAGRRAFYRPCVDWSERRPHLAGGVGAALLDRSLELGWVRRTPSSRALIVTPAGARGYRDRFGVRLDASWGEAYPMPIGSKGVAMVDARDIADVAAIELIRRHNAPGKLPIETINVVGPDTLTGPQVAAIWSDVLGRPIAYGGDDPSGFEQTMAGFMPKWMAYEMRLMAERYVSDGMIPDEGDVERLTALLGRPLHSYREVATALSAA